MTAALLLILLVALVGAACSSDDEQASTCDDLQALSASIDDLANLDLVATNGRKSINPFDVIAVLATVAQQQQETIEALTKRIEALENDK